MHFTSTRCWWASWCCNTSWCKLEVHDKTQKKKQKEFNKIPKERQECQKREKEDGLTEPQKKNDRSASGQFRSGFSPLSAGWLLLVSWLMLCFAPIGAHAVASNDELLELNHSSLPSPCDGLPIHACSFKQRPWLAAVLTDEFDGLPAAEVAWGTTVAAPTACVLGCNKGQLIRTTMMWQYPHVMFESDPCINIIWLVFLGVVGVIIDVTSGSKTTEDLKTLRDLRTTYVPRGLKWRKRKDYLSQALHLGNKKRRHSATHPIRWTLTWRKRRNLIPARAQSSSVVKLAASARVCRLRRYRSVRGRHFMRIKFRHAGPQWVRWLVRQKVTQNEQYQKWLRTIAPLLLGDSLGPLTPPQMG